MPPPRSLFTRLTKDFKRPPLPDLPELGACKVSHLPSANLVILLIIALIFLYVWTSIESFYGGIRDFVRSLWPF